MFKLRIPAILLTLSIVAISVSCRGAGDSALEGKPAPDISLKTVDGKDFKLSDLKGQVVLLDFWATWCPPCRESLPHLQKISANKTLADKGLKVFAVNAQEEEPAVKAFLQKNEMTFTVPLDANGKAQAAYGVTGIPMTIIVGRDGMVAKTFEGYGGEATAKEIDAAVNQALNAPKPAK